MITAEVLQKVMLFALKKHKGQIRKGDGRPYIMHCMSVMTKLRGIKKSKNAFLLAAGSMLHDTKENCGVSIKKISKKFGPQVAALVEEVSTDKVLCKAMGKGKYLAEKMIKMSHYALTLKLVDRWDNVEDLVDVTEEFRTKYIEETKYIISELELKRPNLSKTQLKIIENIKQVYEPKITAN